MQRWQINHFGNSWREFTIEDWPRHMIWTKGEGGGRPKWCPSSASCFQWPVRWKGAQQGLAHRETTVALHVHALEGRGGDPAE